MPPSQPNILLVPDGTLYLAFRLPPLLRRAGFSVDLLCVSGDPLSRSRHISSVLPEETEDALFEKLRGFLAGPNPRWQAVIVASEKMARRLFATGDPAVLSRWQPGALTPGVREFFLSKFGLAAACQNQRLHVPPGLVCHSADEVRDFAGRTGWPVILKPPDEAAGKGVAKFDSPQALDASLATLAMPLLAQKFIRGRRGVVDMLCSNGRPLAWLASHTLNRTGGEFGPSSARLFRAMPELAPLVEEVARFTGFDGFCGFDWIEEEETGRHHLIEFHPRPPSGLRFSRFCGLDLSPAIQAWLGRDGAAFTPLVQPPGKSVAAHYFTSDLVQCLRQRNWRGLIPWLPASGACHDVYWDDAPLFLGWVRECCRRLFRPGQ